MRVAVNGGAFVSRPEQRTYVEQRLLSALGYLSRRVDCMAVSGERIELGPSRGEFRCRGWARLLSGRQVRQEQKDADLYAAVDRVAEELARAVECLESRLPPGTLSARRKRALTAVVLKIQGSRMNTTSRRRGSAGDG
jgi:ribosome-associated translation inhibitor RaiA